MVYMGSKSKYAKDIVPILQKAINESGAQVYIEPFVGGANIIDKIKCEERWGFDRSETLIALLKQARDDFSKIPKDGNREMWDEGKAYVKDGKKIGDMELYEIGAIEFLASFSSRGFPGGYAKNQSNRNYYRERRLALEKQVPLLTGIGFEVSNYYDLKIPDGAVVYCDPPYANTKIYGYANQEKMDYEKFWNWVRELSKRCVVFISEQVAPKDFEVIWENLNVKRTTNKENNFKAVEKLFRWKGEN